MKRVETVYTCDRCGAEFKNHAPDGWYTVSKPYSFIGIKAMYSNCGVGSKYDLCLKCTVEIAKQFVEKIEKEID